jgi:antitoxin FitA
MPNLSIKDVPEAWAECLRQRAALNHRSLQGELLSIIESVVSEKTNLPESRSHEERFAVVGSEKVTVKTVEQIYAQHVSKFPKPLVPRGSESSVSMIRQDRDSR